MKLKYHLLFLSILGCASLLRAGDKDMKPVTAPSDPDLSIPVSHEITMETSYTGVTEMKQGSAKVGGIENWNSNAQYVCSPQITDNILLRFGAAAETNSFGVHGEAPLPNTLRSYNAVIGADFTLSDKIILRVEAHPGLFGDNHLSGDDFMVPVEIGGTYLYSKDLQIIAGLEINTNSSTPFLNVPIAGFPGVRWQFADKWVLSAIPPKWEVQYEYTKAWTFYSGVEVKAGTYRVSKDFGDTHGRGDNQGPTLNSSVMDYTEVRVGLGTTWKFVPGLTLDVSGGVLPYRDFYIDRANVSFHSSSVTPYAELGISGSF